MTTTLRLAVVTAANFDVAIGLKVRRDQEHLVAPVVKSLAEAAGCEHSEPPPAGCGGLVSSAVPRRERKPPGVRARSAPGDACAGGLCGQAAGACSSAKQ